MQFRNPIDIIHAADNVDEDCNNILKYIYTYMVYTNMKTISRCIVSH